MHQRRRVDDARQGAQRGQHGAGRRGGGARDRHIGTIGELGIDTRLGVVGGIEDRRCGCESEGQRDQRCGAGDAVALARQ